MIFKFGKDKLSDFVKVIQFMDKEGIDFEGTGDLCFSIGKKEEVSPYAPPGVEPLVVKDDVLSPMHNLGPWTHDGTICNDSDCKDLSHFGVRPI